MSDNNLFSLCSRYDLVKTRSTLRSLMHAVRVTPRTMCWYLVVMCLLTSVCMCFMYDMLRLFLMGMTSTLLERATWLPRLDGVILRVCTCSWCVKGFHVVFRLLKWSAITVMLLLRSCFAKVLRCVSSSLSTRLQLLSVLLTIVLCRFRLLKKVLEGSCVLAMLLAHSNRWLFLCR